MLAYAPLVLLLALAGPGTDGGVGAVLAESALDPALDATQLTERLARLGPAALPELFAALAHGATGRATTEIEETALLGALEACPRSALREHVRARLAAGADTDERRAFLRALARVATADDLSLLRSVAQAGRESGALASALEEAVAGVLRHDAGAVEAMRHWVLQASPELEVPLVHGVAASTSPRVLEALVELLGYRTTLDHLLVPEIGRQLRRVEKPVSVEVVGALAELLSSDDPGLVREAALALGESENFEATAQLVALLGHEHAGVRAGALTALERLTGLGFGPGFERWRAWYAAESSWLHIHGPDLRQRLHSGSIEAVVQALGEVSQHRLCRGELAAAVALVLQHEDARARTLACSALARLGTSAAVPPLLDALKDRIPSVRHAARVALRALGAEPPTPTDEEPEG